MDSQSQSGDGVPLSREPKDLVYGEHIRRDLKLMEVSEALLKEITENGADIKAASDMDKAYLCTKDCTYAIKTNDNTHHVALVEPAQDEESKVVLSGITAGRFELVEDVSSIDRVYEMLKENPYDGNEDVSMEAEPASIPKGNAYTLDELYEASQISVGEVKEVLEDLSAFQINERWRVFEQQYLNKMVDQIFVRIKLQGWNVLSIPVGELEQIMVDEGHNIAAVHSCISLLGNSTEGKDMDDLWKLDEQKVCVHFAKRLLVRESWTFNEFVREWSRSLPSGFKPSKDMLFGEAIINEAQGTIKGFCKDDLPKDYRARVKAIFAQKDLWDPDELRKYLCDAKFPGEWSLDVALLELCQKCRFRLNDPEMYCIRSSAFTAG